MTTNGVISGTERICPYTLVTIWNCPAPLLGLLILAPQPTWKVKAVEKSRMLDLAISRTL